MSTAPEAVVEIVDAAFGYGGAPVLTGVGFTVLPGEAVALIGPAGQLALFSPDQPGNFIFCRLLATRTVQVCRFLFLPFVEKLAFFHSRRN